MRVLLLHSRYRTGAVSGETRVMEDEAALLQTAGHDVRLHAPTPTPTSKIDTIRLGMTTIWSRDSDERLRSLLQTWKPDIAHCHNLFPALSPSVIRLLDDNDVPVVMTLHNYRLMCLPGTFLRDGHICEDCHGGTLAPGVRYRCYQDSVAASTALASSLTLHRRLHTFDRVRLYLAVSEFLAHKYRTAGITRSPIQVKENFAWAWQRREGPGEYFLFVGRLTPEKGIAPLLTAWAGVDAKLVMAGTGPMESDVRAAASTNIDFRGAITPEEVSELLLGARALIVPSVWYEGAPRSILEAYAAGVPVITSRLGGMAETVEDGETGVLAAPGDPDALRDAVTSLMDDAASERMGAAAYETWQARYTPQRAITNLEQAYATARRA